MTEKKLTLKQKQFCEEYVLDLNATQAAIRAGYSKKTAYAIGQENLKKPEIQNYLTNLRTEVKERNKITIDELVKILADIARFDPVDILNDDGTIKPINQIPKGTRNAIASLEIEESTSIGINDGAPGSMKFTGLIKKIKLVSKEGAIDKLLKHLGGYEKNNEQKKSNINFSSLSNETIKELLNANIN
ncbi:terminase small subunit [Apibacter muscae]|uniref:terminase small subunit n=1 Tax=Apibacter muscae TaxID=2509004 RepID=UPI0011ABF3C5|nr:terminase small subunit [Apibacter muscae]TWP23123.1 terminase small subunit [Apibacter muscae]